MTLPSRQGQPTHFHCDTALASATTSGLVQFSHRFDVGAILVSPRALRVLQRFGVDPSDLVHRHASGDWGDARADMRDANEQALRSGGWLVSAYVMRSPIGVPPHREVLCVTTDTAGRFTTVQVRDENAQAPS